jgi:hypothetical protein
MESVMYFVAFQCMLLRGSLNCKIILSIYYSLDCTSMLYTIHLQFIMFVYDSYVPV